MEMNDPISDNNATQMIIGHIVAGFPSPAEAVLQDIITLDEFLRPMPKTSILFRINDSDMKDECILEGDIVVVEKSRKPRNGHLVLAAIDGNWIVRRLKKRGRDFYMESSNSRSPAIRPLEELQIIGVVTAMVRLYRT